MTRTELLKELESRCKGKCDTYQKCIELIKTSSGFGMKNVSLEQIEHQSQCMYYIDEQDGFDSFYIDEN